METEKVTSTDTILVVDDETGIRQSARGVLADEGYRVVEASDGRGARQLIAKGRDQGPGEGAAHDGGQRDREPPAGGAQGISQVEPGAFDLLQDAACMGQQPLAGFGQRHAASIAFHQRLAQLDFQRADLPAERRLGDPQIGRRPGETAVVGHLHEVLELPEVHCRQLCPFAISDRPAIALTHSRY